MDEQTCLSNSKMLHELHGKVERETGANATEHASFKRRLDDLEESSKRQNEILLALQRQGDAIEAMNGKIDRVATSMERIDRRVETIEHEPADRWKTVTLEIIKYIVLAVVGVAVGYFING